MATFGERLKALRKEKKLTQTEFGEILGVELNAVSGWERNLHFPELDMVEKMMGYFDVPWEYLLGIVDDRDYDPEITVSDEEIAADIEAEEKAQTEKFLKLFYDLSPEMKSMVLATIDRAHMIDEQRGALISQQKDKA